MESSTVKSGKRFAVVGSGISGIAAAYALDRAGHDVEVIERDAVAGGRFGVDTLGERPIMTGGKNLGSKYTELRGFLAAMGADRYEPFGINTSRVVNGKLEVVDNPGARSRTVQMLRKFGSRRDVAKLVYYAGRVKTNDENRFLGSDFFVRTAAKHDHKPLSAYFGPEMVKDLIRPATVRMNGAEPDEVYLGTFGTNVSMLMDHYDQLTDGVQPALAEFAKRVPIRCNSAVVGLVVREGAVVGLEISADGRPPQQESFDGVVLATPAHATAAIVADDLPALGKVLGDVAYFPAVVVVVEYDKPLFTDAVRAMTLDDGPCSNVGAYGKDDLNIIRYTFSGRGARELPADGNFDSWLDDAEQRVRDQLGVGPLTKVRKVTKHWPAAYCAYQPFHGDFLAKVTTEIESVTGLVLAGDYLRGAPLEACFRSGLEAATRLTA